jgi:hypothetical protein
MKTNTETQQRERKMLAKYGTTRLRGPIGPHVPLLPDGLYLVDRGQLDAFLATMASIGATIGATYAFSGPSRQTFAYTLSRTFALRVFDDGGLDWLVLQRADASPAP